MATTSLTKNSAQNSIPVEIAQQMTQAFRESQKTDQSSFSQAAWFPAQQIAQLNEKVLKCGGDGVRIYFGRYTSKIIDQINKLPYGDQVPATNVDMNTVLFVITKIVNGKAKTDYFIDGSTGPDPVPIETDPENRGELCPEVCDNASPLMNG